MSLINDVLEQIDARSPVAEHERLVIEPSAYSESSKKRLSLPASVKMALLALGGFFSGYGVLEIIETAQRPSVSVKTLESTVLTAEVMPAQPRAAAGAPAIISAQELSTTGQLTPVFSSPANSADEALLLQAKQYYLADRLTYPPLQNAYQLYRELLIKNPQHPAALEGVAEIKRRYLALTSEAINQGAAQKAQRYIERAEFIGVGAEELNPLRNQLHLLITQASLAGAEGAEIVADEPAGDASIPEAEELGYGATESAEAVQVAFQHGTLRAEPMAKTLAAQAQGGKASIRSGAAANMPEATLAAPTAQKPTTKSAYTKTGASLNTIPTAADSEQVFLASLVEDKNSERSALDFIKSHGNSADTVRWLARRWVSSQEWLALLDLMNEPSGINSTERHIFRAQALLGLKNYDELIGWLSNMRELQQPELQRILAVALQKKGREAEALVIYQSLVARHPENSGLWLALGLSADTQGNNTLAREAFFRAQQLGGHSKTVRDFLSRKLTSASP